MSTLYVIKYELVRSIMYESTYSKLKGETEVWHHNNYQFSLRYFQRMGKKQLEKLNKKLEFPAKV